MRVDKVEPAHIIVTNLLTNLSINQIKLYSKNFTNTHGNSATDHLLREQRPEGRVQFLRYNNQRRSKQKEAKFTSQNVIRFSDAKERQRRRQHRN